MVQVVVIRVEVLHVIGLDVLKIVARNAVFPAEGHQAFAIRQVFWLGQRVRRQIRKQQNHQLTALFFAERLVAQQKRLSRFQQLVDIAVRHFLALELFAHEIRHVRFAVIAQKAASLVGHGIVERRFELFIGFQRIEPQADGLEDVRQGFHAELPEHEQAVEIQAVFPACVQIIGNLVAPGGEIGREPVVSRGIFLGAVEVIRFKAQNGVSRAVFAIDFAGQRDFALKRQAGHGSRKGG